MNQGIAFASILLLIFLLLGFSSQSPSFLKEGFTLDKASGKYPNAQYEVLVQDSFPITHKVGVVDANGASLYKSYPVFQVGSFKQLTNNLRFWKSPDNGTCMPAGMCGTLYQSKRNKSNVVKPLPPVCISTDGARVGYWNTHQNLLPYTNDEVNVLY